MWIVGGRGARVFGRACGGMCLGRVLLCNHGNNVRLGERWEGKARDNVLLDTRVCTAPRRSRSASPSSVHPIRSFNNRRYLGHRCTIVNNQSLRPSFAHLGWDCCCLSQVVKGALYVNAGDLEEEEDGPGGDGREVGVVREERAERDVGKEVMNGV